MMCGFDKEAAFAMGGNVYTPAAINSTHGRKYEHDSSRMGTLQRWGEWGHFKVAVLGVKS